MPNRIIKESICASETIDSLNAEEERFFYRLLVQCDDYGCMDARPSVLIARCFTLRIREIDDATITAWLRKLAAVGLLYLYEAGGQPYLQMATWEKHQQIRARRRKYPPPPTLASDSNHMISGDINCDHTISDDSKRARNPIQSNPNPIQPEPNSGSAADGSANRDTAACRKDCAELFQTLAKLNIELNERAKERYLDVLATDAGGDVDKMLRAISSAVNSGNNAPTPQYLAAILRNWRREGQDNKPRPRYPPPGQEPPRMVAVPVKNHYIAEWEEKQAAMSAGGGGNG